MNKKQTILELKNKLYEEYDIIFKEDDPAWIMTLIYNDLLNNTLEVVSKFDENKISTENIERFGAVLENINTLQIEAQNSVENARKKAEDLDTKLSTKHKQIIDDVDSKITTLNSTINTAINNVNIDTSKLSDIIDEKVENIDTEKLVKTFKNFNNAFIENEETLKNKQSEMLEKEAIFIKKFEAQTKEKEAILEDAKKATKELNHILKKPKLLLFSFILTIFISLGTGVIISKYLVDKPFVTNEISYKSFYNNLSYSHDKKWVNISSIQTAFKKAKVEDSTPFDMEILWWLPFILVIGFFYMLKTSSEE